MKKLTLLLVAVFVMLQTVSAREISVSEAKSVAERFSATNSHLKSGRNLPLNLAYVERAQDLNCVYVFTRGTNNGYVVVSGDDRTAPVLGYADNGTVDAENLPENVKWWLGEYARQIQYLNENGAEEVRTVKPYNFTTEVKPLLTSKWNQDAPYNNLCPELNGTRTVVGCAATAAAQIMYYHKHPKQGEGTMTYSWNAGGRNITEDFSKVTFDWDNMKDSYNASSTEAEKLAAAQLSYYVGVASQMNYNVSSAGGSGATTVATITGMFKHFGYDEGMEQLMRDVTPHAEWIKTLVAELDNQRPIFYSGATGEGAGHAFVFDGYNKDGYFHVNWGWGGMSDGYFLTEALDPMTHGIGGANAGFNYSQTATVGIKAKDNVEKYNPNLFITNSFTTGASAIDKGGKATFYINGHLVINCLVKTDFKLGIGVYNSADELVYSLFQSNNYTLDPGYGYNGLTLYNMTLPADIADGEYRLFPVSKFGTDPEIKKVRAAVNGKTYVGMKVEGSKINFSAPNAGTLAVETLAPEGKLINGAVASVNTVVANNSSDEYYDMLLAAIYNKADMKTVQTFAPVLTALSPGEKRDITFEAAVTAPAGDYGLALVNSQGIILESIDITVEAPAEVPALTLTKKSELLGSAGIDEATKLPLVNKNDLTYRAYLSNTGGYFSGYLHMRVWKAVKNGSMTSWNFVTEFKQMVSLDKNESVELTYNAVVSDLVPGEKYRCSLYNGNSEIKASYGRAMFIATDKGGSVESVEAAKIAVYPNAVAETLNVVAPVNVKSVEIFSLLGTKVADVRGESSELSIDVAHLLPSAYIVVVTAEDGSKMTQKIIKK